MIESVRKTTEAPRGAPGAKRVEDIVGPEVHGAGAACREPRERTWQEALKRAVRDPLELCRIVAVGPRYEAGAIAASRDFPVFAPHEYIARMRRGDVRDPLLRQVLPLDAELDEPPGFSRDPLEERAAEPSPGLLHKYRSRVLMVATGACAVHCRYCFRRHFPYAEGPRSPEDWRPALAAIAADPKVDEIILSGGDPLTLVDARLAQLAHALAAIGHVRRLRIHTRLPIMIPQRVTDELIGWLHGTRLVSVVVVHANHANELDEAVAGALARLADSGIVLLNQSVLLRGVNDDVDALEALSRRLVDLRVMPYYLHQLDRVLGASHFEVSVARGRRLIHQLRGRLPGYAVPRYVREVPGAEGKTILA